MECNKEEAVKAMQIAEKKLENSDYIGARKMAQTAHRLFPTLENITQLLTVCEIHCSAQNRIYGSENDWYGILQIEQSADETTIKKQYRKLALLLHPDKNKFAGAEAAFKLVGEANRLLSDKSKRRLYDMKYGVARRNIAPSKPSHDQPNGYATVNKQASATANGFSNVPYSNFPGSNSFKPPQMQAFWTCCPFCNVRYQYLKCYLNKMLRCQNCGRGFISHDLNNPTGPPTFHQGHVPQKKVAPESGPSKSAAQSKRCSDKKSQDSSARVDRVPSASNTAGNDLKAKSGKKQKADGDVKYGQSNGVKPKSDAEMNGKENSRSDAATGMKKGVPKSENKKRQRKSANNSENSIEDEDDSISEKEPSLSRNNCQRRSSRNKKHVSYMKYLSDDDDNLQSPKKSRGGASSTDLKEKMKDATSDAAASKVGNSSVLHDTVDGHKKDIKLEVPAPHSEVLPNTNPKYEKLKVMREGTTISDKNDKKSEVEDVDAERSNVKEVHVLVCDDPEFSDFDQDKGENCFAVNQVWAIYDSTCGMPRFYARIKKVFSPEFKLQITWFEPDPDDKDEIDWCDAELPVACGKYTLGGTEETVDLPMFSHLIHCPKRGPRRAYLMYPRKGETWALFKNWDIRWSSDPENHASFEYEFVEILSDFVEDAGISVAYMDKVKGFVCLFQTTEEHKLSSFQIPPKHLYRFSHQIPSFRMTGKERKGVPKGSFELDPSALPPNINDHDDLNNVNGETDDCKSNETEVEVTSFENNPAANVQKKSNPKKSIPRSEDLILRRSPRKSHPSENGAQVNTVPEDDGSKDASQKGLSTQKDGSKDASQKGLSTQKEGSTIHTNEGTNTPKKHGKNGIERETMILRRSPRDLNKKNAG